MPGSLTGYPTLDTSQPFLFFLSNPCSAHFKVYCVDKLKKILSPLHMCNVDIYCIFLQFALIL